MAMKVKSWLNWKAVAILLLNQFSWESHQHRLMFSVFSSTCVASWHLHGLPNQQMVPVVCLCVFASSYLTHTASQICFCVLAVTKFESSHNSWAQSFTDCCIEEFSVCRLWDFFWVVCLTREESEMFSEKMSSINASICLLYFSFLFSSSFFTSSRRWESCKFAWNQKRSCRWSMPQLFVFTVIK